jgi:hypothetical protein
VPKKVSSRKMEYITRVWRKLHSLEFYNLYIIRVMRARVNRLSRHVTRMKEVIEAKENCS